MDSVFVIKADGQKEQFSEVKLRSSIGRAGIGKDMADEVVAHIQSILRPDIQTSEIYSHIIEFLGKSPAPHFQSKYSLKQAIMALGPAGYAFEDFIAAVLKNYGYETKTRQVESGACVSHEIDVEAEKDGRRILVECKFHNQSGSRCDVKTTLYLRARFEDLQDKFDEVWLVTNTKLTSDAIQYARCKQMKIISWGYPENNNLQTLVEDQKLYPVTCLSNLSNYQKSTLLEKGIVLCRDLPASKVVLQSMGLSEADISHILSEIASL